MKTGNQKEYEINYDFDDNGLIRLFGDQTEEDTTNVETQIGNTFGNIMNNGLVMQGRIYVPCRIIKSRRLMAMTAMPAMTP